jgi:hypothetical protein
VRPVGDIIRKAVRRVCRRRWAMFRSLLVHVGVMSLVVLGLLARVAESSDDQLSHAAPSSAVRAALERRLRAP